MIITYKRFEEYMNKLKEIMELDKELDHVLYKISNDFGGFYDERSIELILSLLKDLTDDKYDDIEYYIFELNWGKEWYEGCITDSDGHDIPFGTLKDLYNYLEEHYED